MTYTASDLQYRLEELGEMMVVLESGEQYDLHLHDTEFDDNDDSVTTEGMHDGEYKVINFPASRVEHFIYHKES